MSYQGRARKFGRKRDQRRQMLRSLARSLVLHEKITTTEARAKSIQPYIEKLVTKAAIDELAIRRLLLARFCNDNIVVTKLLQEIGPRYKERKGGYTRIIKVEPRPGSGRSVAVIEFI